MTDRLAEVVKALEKVRDALLRADPIVLIDTLWMPEDISMGETIVDFITHALEAAPPIEE